MFGLTNQQLGLGAIAAIFLLSKAGKLKPLWEKAKSLLPSGVSAVKDALTPQETVADIMDHLLALDAYSDKYSLGWGEQLQKMLADAGKNEFDREVTSETT